MNRRLRMVYYGVCTRLGYAYCADCAAINGATGEAITDPFTQSLQYNGDACDRCGTIIGSALYAARAAHERILLLGAIHSAVLTAQTVEHVA